MKKRLVCCFLILGFLLLPACKKREEIVYVAPTPQPETETVILERESGEKRYFEVTGSGEYIAAPDYATVTLKVSARGQTAEEATQLCSEEVKNVIRKAFVFGIYSRNINQRGVELEQVQNSDGTEIIAYTATDILALTVDDTSKVEHVSASLVDLGNYDTPVIAYSILDVTEAYKNALDDAVRDARSKAEKIAEASGEKITDVLSITEIPAMESSYTEQTYDSSQIRVGATVTVRYEIAG